MRIFVQSLQGASAFFMWKGVALLIVGGLVMHVVGGARRLTAFESFSGGQSLFVAAIGSFFFCGAVMLACSPSIPLALLLPAVSPRIVFGVVIFSSATVLLLISWFFAAFDDNGLSLTYSWAISGGIGMLATGIFRDQSMRMLAVSFLCTGSMIIPMVFPDAGLAYAFSVSAVMAGPVFPAVTLVFCAFLWLTGGLLLMRQVDYEK